MQAEIKVSPFLPFLDITSQTLLFPFSGNSFGKHDILPQLTGLGLSSDTRIILLEASKSPVIQVVEPVVPALASVFCGLQVADGGIDVMLALEDLHREARGCVPGWFGKGTS